MVDIVYSIFYKSSETNCKIEDMTYHRKPNEPLKNLLKWFDNRVEELSSREKIDANDVFIYWKIGKKNYCYNSGVMWY